MKTTTQIAEELAAKYLGDHQKNELNDVEIEEILEHIPLLELLEVARAAKELTKLHISTPIKITARQKLEKALSNLQAKLPEL